MAIPKKLGRPPLVEVIFEMRFGSSKSGTAGLLPGLLFASLKPWFDEVKTSGPGMLPPDLLRQHPELAYAIAIQLTGVGRVLHLGPQVVALNVTRYPGWEQFGGECTRLARAVKDTDLLGTPERFSLKYANVIEHPPNEPLRAVPNRR